MPEGNPIIKPAVWRLFVFLFFLFLVFVIYKIFPLISDVVVVLIISLVLTYVFRPAMVYLEQYGIKREITILGIFVVAIGLFTLALRYMIPMLADEIAGLVDYMEKLNLELLQSKISTWLHEKSPRLASMINLDGSEAEDMLKRIQGAASGFLKQSLTILASAANVLSLSIVVPFVTFFLLKDGDVFMKNLIENVPNRFFEMSVSLSYRIDQQLGNYIRSVLIESLIIGILVWIAFEIVGIKFALVLGLLNGLLNMIPFFGPMLAYIPVGLVILITYDPIGIGLLWMAITLGGVQVIDNVLLKPILISRSVDVHPTAVLLAVLIGGRIAGALGMFIAVPVYGIIKVVILDFYKHLKAYKII